MSQIVGPLDVRIEPSALKRALSSGEASDDPDTSMYTQVHDRIGRAICDRRLPTGSVFTVEDIEAATGASRSIVREAARVLGSLGLLHARKRVGLTILPDVEWNLYDPQVIRWRLDSSERHEQVRALLEVRMAIEPEAARLASGRCSTEQAGRLVSAAGDLWAAGIDGDPEDFSRDDANFHRLVLDASGNSMFMRLSGVIRESLHDRNLNLLSESHASMEDVRLHLDLANHIQRREGDEAAGVAREIIRRTQENER